MNHLTSPSITVILPILNEEADLANCISAILQQDYAGEIEIILALGPAHLNKAGKTIPAVHSKINSAFNWGGAPLLIQTIEEMTQLKIDHYVEVNFAGFARVIDSLGGFC